MERDSVPGQCSEERWRGVVELAVGTPVASLWSIACDFCGMDRWVSSVEECFMVEGEGERIPGCVRRVIGTSVPREDGEKSWVDERLVSFDDVNRSLSYAIVDGNIAGLRGYSASLRVYVPEKSGDGVGFEAPSSVIEWSFEMDPDPGSSGDATIEMIRGILRRNAEQLDAAARKIS